MKMPKPDQDIIARRSEIIRRLQAIVPGDGVITNENELSVFECDGLMAYKQLPMVVVLPESTQQVSNILKACQDMGVKIVPRGAGTGLSGGALPLADGVTLGLSKFNKILDIDLDNRCAVVQPGVTNQAVTNAVMDDNFYYAPDPSSKIACTIGGNVAENAGGMHCLKYGLTTNNLLGVEMVLMDGDVIRLGGKHLDAGGLDLLGAITGSEGLLGIITEVTVRILKKPQTARAMLVGFDTVAAGGNCVAKIISSGIVPGAMEMMDKVAIDAMQRFVDSGYPLDVEALLVVELDGPEAEVDYLVERIEQISKDVGSTFLRVSQTEQEREQFWKGRMSAFPSIGRISPDYLTMDGTIPRHRLPDVLTRMNELSEQFGLRVANVFHAGDGNLHPLILYDANVPGDLDKAEEFGSEILKLCVEVGGVLSGEHGIGVEKRDLMGEMFTEDDMKQQQRLKCAFDTSGLLNPGKVYPTLHRCAELGHMHVHGGKLPFPDIPRY
ncbi:MAG: FAD-binding oxidoreductase [Rhodospirillaceae bacterium]|nr:MAG: FAD-binding oxidoreductase [Rhodospirillaceae bacterium]